MRDKISLERCQILHPKVREEVIMCIEDAEAKFPANIKVRIVQGLRTIEEQNELYAQGRTKPGAIITKAKGGSSFHNYGLAIDFALMYDKNNDGNFEELSWDIKKDFDEDHVADWGEVISSFEAKGWSWGGRWRTFKDYPHMEKTFGYKWRDLLAKHNNKDFLPGYHYANYVNI